MPKYKPLKYTEFGRKTYNKQPCNFQDFKQITDLLFEIAKYDSDPGNQKRNYLDSAIAKWKNFHPQYQCNVPIQSQETEKPQDIENIEKHCYRCDEILTQDHHFYCPGKNSLCIHCNRIGHLKGCCGHLGYFPHPPRKY